MARNAVASGASAIKPPVGKALAEGTVQDLISATPNMKRLVVQARERGVVTVDEINAALPEEEVSPDQLEELIAMFEDMGVSVARDEDGGNGSGGGKGDLDDLGGGHRLAVPDCRITSKLVSKQPVTNSSQS